MDYDRYDAFLHHVFKQTQGDLWFRPNQDAVSVGVALRADDGDYRVFPYEDMSLEPFELAVRALNPAVAVKVRSAAVHSALAEIGSDEKAIIIDVNARIQILETMVDLPNADKEQSAAFIRDERVLVVWADSMDAIIPTCRDFEDRLIKLLSRPRPAGIITSASRPVSVVGGSSIPFSGLSSAARFRRPSKLGSYASGYPATPRGVFLGSGGVLGMSAEDLRDEKDGGVKDAISLDALAYEGHDVEANVEQRKAVFLAPIYNGAAAGLSLLFIGKSVSIMLAETRLDGNYLRFALCAIMPLFFCVSLFFSLQLVQNISMAVGPIAQYHSNSKYYSAVKPAPNRLVDNNLPHITIQMPVYKESLEAVLAPSIESLKKAMQTYARQGGTSTILVNDDGLRLLPVEERDARIRFYANHGIGWVARPKHDDTSSDGFKRAGRFKKASNMNYGLSLSLKAEKHLAELLGRDKDKARPGAAAGHDRRHSELHFGMQYQNHDGEDQGTVTVDEWEDLEEKALQMAIDEVYEASGRRFRPWAANGRACRLGEIILLVDSDTVVPDDCLRDAAREMAECPTVAIIQHESDVMQVAHHYFENGVAYFTWRINKCISISCANGEVPPFVGHNAFLRWRAIQDAAFVDKADGQEKIWSESNVSEDFDMALRLQMRGYIIRWSTYSQGGFKEGVSLTIDDEINRWQKYAYGCNEMLFNPVIQWWRKGPIGHQMHKFMWSNAPLHYKLSMLAYMSSYYGIAAAFTISVLNYVLLGLQFPVDGFYMHSFEIWLATTVVFYGSGNIGFTLLEYRLGEKSLISAFLQNIKWLPFFFFFFGGLSIPVSQAILAHCFSYNMTWGATKKEVERSNFFKEVPQIFKRRWFPWMLSWVVLAGIVLLSTPLVPYEYRIDGDSWGVIFPLASVVGCHILTPIVLNPWLMIFSY
ncbi:glycosyl transferase family group 2-domain-containing protein [Daedaleopsis nitida]|nr:glycosyl transferase family group 2-domain-containing protein [Daedaleopsis nitida]